MLAPSLSIGRDGNVTLNFGTGDTNFIGTATNQNYAYAVEEVAPQLVGSSAVRLLASLDWWLPFPTAGEMITGPASVFDGGYYFATFRPSGGSACTAEKPTSGAWTSPTPRARPASNRALAPRR